MGTCVRCGMSGAFVKVDEEGLCILCRKGRQTAPVSSEIRSVRGCDLDVGEVISRYLTTDHRTYPSQYNVVDFYRAEFDCMLDSLPRVPVHRRLCDAPHGRAECVYLRSLEGCRLEDCADFVVIDTETSGLTASAEIVEVSAVRFSGFRPQSVFTALCKPYGGISPQAEAVHGISQKDVADAPRFAEILTDLTEFTQGVPLVAHNAPFDMKMLAAEGFDTYGKGVYDTLPIARGLLRDSKGNKLEHYRLADCCRACAILFSGAHRSTADAMATGLLFLELVKRRFGRQNLLEPWSNPKS